MTAFFNERCRILRRSFWQPSPEEAEPDISFTDSRFRRRLSLVSKMTIKVIHDIMPLDEDTAVYFISFRGEVNQQFKINKMLLEEGDILPAAFSMSVFNTPPALASIALNLKGGYSAVCPGGGEFSSALLGASAALEAAALRKAGDGTDKKSGASLVLVYADETLIPEYHRLEKDSTKAMAFAVLLNSPPDAGLSETGSFPAAGNCKTPECFWAALEASFKENSRL